MFDITTEVRFAVRGAVRNFDARLRFPTDEEIAKAAENGSPDAEVCARLRLDDGPSLTNLEAERVLTTIIRAQPVESLTDQAHRTAKVTLSVPGSQTKHTLRLLGPDQVLRYAGKKSLSLRALGGLYDELLVSATGYEGRVPLNHKATVVAEIIQGQADKLTANFASRKAVQVN